MGIKVGEGGKVNPRGAEERRETGAVVRGGTHKREDFWGPSPSELNVSRT